MKILLIILSIIAISNAEVKYRLLWPFGLPVQSYSDAEKAIEFTRDLGFNILVSGQNGKELGYLIEAGQKKNIPIYGVVTFEYEGALKLSQVVKPEEKAKLKEIRTLKKAKNYKDQFGGEPVEKGDIFDLKKMMCFNNPKAYGWAKEQVMKKAAVSGIAGIAYDWFGYNNYYGCFCEYCETKKKEYSLSHPGVSEEQLDKDFYLSSMVDFLNKLDAEVKAKYPNQKSTCHVYPVYLPEPLYGNRFTIDFPGQTASWFFQPFWSYEKIKNYTGEIVKGAKKYNSTGTGTPFIGLYGKDYYKGDERISEEFKIIAGENAEGVMLASNYSELIEENMNKALKKAMSFIVP